MSSINLSSDSWPDRLNKSLALDLFINFVRCINIQIRLKNMIKYSIKCNDGHVFDSWFKAGKAFDDLIQRKMLLCPVCGSCDVEKALMTPSVAVSQHVSQISPTPEVAKAPDNADKLQALRSKIEASTEYVGERFASEARAMYLGDIPDRPIYGEAKPMEAKALIEEGVPVLPLPFIPSRKSN